MLPITDSASIRSASVLARNHTSSIPIEVRTLSAREAMVVAACPLDGERMLLKLETDDPEIYLLECAVAHRSEYHRVGWGAGEDTYSACRLRFLCRLDVTGIHPSLKAALDIAEASDTAEFDLASEREEESLMPVLSAIGLLVVYASQAPWEQLL